MTYHLINAFPFSRAVLLAMLAALVLLLTPPVQAQSPFEFGDEPVAEDAAPTDAEAADATAPTASQPAPPVDALALAAFARRDAAVVAVLGLPRETPVQKFRAVTMLIDLGHPDVAALVLPELLQTQLDDAQRAALVREFGEARFLKLIRLDSPLAAGAAPTPLAGIGAFAQAALDAAAAEARDPQRIAALVAQLQAPTEEERYAARVDLRATGDAGVVAAFAALAAAETVDARTNIMLALAQMRPAVDEPLMAVLADAQGMLRRDAAELAGHVELRAALPLLAALAVSADTSAAAAAQTSLARLGMPAPTAAEAQELLRKRLADAKAGGPLPATIDVASGRWWSWDAEADQPAVAEFPLAQLRALYAARLSRALAEAGGAAIPADQRLTVLYGLEEAALLAREPSPALQQAVAAMTPVELSEALESAAAQSFTAAAVKIAGELGRRGDASILATSDGRPSPLAAALISPERNLRFAALGAIMQLAPSRSFPGSSYVPEALWYFVAAAGDPTAIVAAPDIVEASDWAGQLRGAGYEATPARWGRDVLMAALDPANSARLGVVVLQSDIGQPLLGEVVYQLHTNERTAATPILVLSTASRLAAAQRIADADPLVFVAPRPHGEGALASLVEQTIALTASPLAPQEARTAQAAQALIWLGQLLAQDSAYDELQRDGTLVSRTLLTPELSVPSMTVLASLGTAQSQIALLDYASVPTLPIEARRAAAAAFATSVERFGLNISHDEIQQQYDRYNASETADADTQQVLGQILDVIEKK